jgi:hypothetical protein
LKPGGHLFDVDIVAPSLEKLYKKDINNRTTRAMDFGRPEKSLRCEDWLAVLLKSRVPDTILSYEPGPETKSQQVRKIQNYKKNTYTGSVLMKRDKMNLDVKETADTCVNRLFILSAY